MDLQKAKIFLDKISREFARMQKDPENIATIDVDILKQYVRDFYDSILTEKTSVVFTATAPSQSKPAAEPPAPKPSRPIGFNPERPAKSAPLPVVQEEITYSEPMAEQITRPEPPIFEVEPPVAKQKTSPPPEPVYQPTIEKITEPAPPPSPQAPVFHVSPETLALFEFKAAKELSEKLSELPIADLKKALSLNDRLLMTRELFGGDGKSLETTVATINSLPNFEDAKSYLIQFCAERFDWSNKVRVEHARTFIKLVRRRFK